MKFLQIITIALLITACNQHEAQVSDWVDSDELLMGERHFISGYEPITENSLVNVVIEIPAGTDAKWEVEKETGHIAWEYRDGKPRVVQYIGYPGNYGMVPRTLAGDGDTVDVLVLGAPIERGVVAETRIIGVLEMLDDGEQDDKLIAVTTNSHFDLVNNMEELDQYFRGVSTIIEIWFDNYKGPDNSVEILGLNDAERAWEILQDSIDKYNE